MVPPTLREEPRPLSFFDDADAPRRTEPSRPTARRTGAASRQSRPRSTPPRRSGGGGRGPGGGGGELSDVRRRQLILGASVVVVLIILVLGIRSCTSSARKRGLRDYSTNVSNIVRKSDAQVSTPLFRLLGGATGSGTGGGVDLQNQLNNLKVEADDQLSQASNLDVPGDVTDAQRYVLLTLELRRDGVQRIAEKIQEVKGNAGESAIRSIAGQMRAFDASDVIWSQRVIPLIKSADEDAGVTPDSAPVATTAFLKDSAWLDPTYVAERLGSSVGSSNPNGPAAPGTHGHALTSVTVGSTTLNSAAVNRIPASPAPVFIVKITNQGENDERNVRVRVEAPGGTVQRTIAVSPKGQESTATVPLSKSPPVNGSVAQVKVTVVPVAGEKTTDNNTQTYPVLFTK
jgi:hypothetical protein